MALACPAVNQHGNEGLAPLHLAAEAGSTEDLRVLLENGADANLRTRRPCGARVDTALHIAARNGDCAVLKLLLAHGADCGVNTDRTALHDAPDGECILALVEAGADVNATNGEGETPLHRVAMNVSHNRMPYAKVGECVAALLEAGAEVNATASDGGTPLLSLLSLMEKDDFFSFRARPSDSDMEHCLSTLSLLLQYGADATARSSHDTALQFTLDERVDHEAKKMLLKHGAEVNAISNGPGEKACGSLSAAVHAGNVETVKMMLAAGAYVNARTPESGCTALHLAADFNSDTVIAKLLLEHGANLELRNDYGQTALLRAAGGSLEHAKLFLEHGADVNAVELRSQKHSEGPHSIA